MPEPLQSGSVLLPAYEAKMKVLNEAIQEIGIGRYQYSLFVVAGFGWFADSVWPLLTGLILAPVVSEFHFNGAFLSLAANIGLLVGALLWGLGCDIWGRRWSFNATLFITGAFGLAAGGSNSVITLSVLFALVGVGVGGNIPVDSTVFLGQYMVPSPIFDLKLIPGLDFMPASHQYLLTLLAVFWSLGQFFVNLVAWPLISKFSCPLDKTTCNRSENMGWRYLLFLLGGLTLFLSLVRGLLFPLHESPRYLLGKDRDDEAIVIVQSIAAYNGKECSLSSNDLIKHRSPSENTDQESQHILTRTSLFTAERIKALFSSKKMALSTILLILIWGTIGLASTLYNTFLPYLLAKKGITFGDASLSIAYRNQLILSVVGLPGPLIAGWAVEVPRFGRRGALATFCVLTGCFLFGSTSSRSSRELLGWNCGYAFTSNAMYSVLYAFSSEIFPAKDRGTGNGLVSSSARVFGVVAPLLALYVNITTAVPVYIAATLIIVAAFMTMLIPYEVRGKASM